MTPSEFLLNTIRKYGPYTTDDLFAEIMLIRRLGNGDDLPATLRELESQLAELERIGDVMRDGDVWRPVWREVKTKRQLQGSLWE